MTYFEPTIQRLMVESFRGFRDQQGFDLSASAVIVTGPNGTGKTSFFDALQWCFLGSIQRLEGLRARRNVEHIVNQYRIGRKAAVEVELSLGGLRVVARRTGDHSGSTLELKRDGRPALFGAEAEETLRDLLLPQTSLSLESALTTSGLMQQDVMRGVLEAKPADRYRHLSTVLGLGRLEDFEEATRSLARDAGERRKQARGERDRHADALQRARDRAAEARIRLESAPQLDALRSELHSLLSAPPSWLAGPRDSLDLRDRHSVRELAAELGTAVDVVGRITALVDRTREVQAAAPDEPPTSAELVALRSAVDLASEDLAEAEARRSAAQRELDAARRAAEDVAQLAALAIPLLGEGCPVCRQPIDAAHVAADLRERAEGTDAITSLQNLLAERSAELEIALGRVADARAALETAERGTALWEKRKAAELEVEAALEQVRSGTFVALTAVASTNDWPEMAGEIMEFVISARRRALEYLDAFEARAERGVTDRAMAEVAGFERSISEAEEVLAREERRAERLATLADQATAARIDVTERRVNALQPLVSSIYQRLDPHPAFKSVEFELDTYYRRGTTSALVRDPVAGISADPLMVFSTSQANIVALSYFIAMSLSAGNRGLSFMLLDDPVQSMDDVNVLGFADLCRHLRSRRQLIVSTHERRFAGLLERKLTPRTDGVAARVIRFTGWDRSGPLVDQSEVAPLVSDDPKVVRIAG